VDVPTTKWDTERPNCKSLWVTRKKGIKVRLLIKALKEKNLSKPKHGSFSINNPTGIRRQRKIVLKNTLKGKNEDQINAVRNLQFYISFKVLHKMQTTKFVVAIRLDRETWKVFFYDISGHFTVYCWTFSKDITSFCWSIKIDLLGWVSAIWRGWNSSWLGTVLK
jgi:hypothetical protein